MDVKDFYLNNRMDRAEYIMIQIYTIPMELVIEYYIKDKVHDGYIFALLTKGIYGLPQSGQIVHDVLLQHLTPYGYHPSINTPGQWKHDS